MLWIATSGLLVGITIAGLLFARHERQARSKKPTGRAISNLPQTPMTTSTNTSVTFPHSVTR